MKHVPQHSKALATREKANREARDAAKRLCRVYESRLDPRASERPLEASANSSAPKALSALSTDSLPMTLVVFNAVTQREGNTQLNEESSERFGAAEELGVAARQDCLVRSCVPSC